MLILKQHMALDVNPQQIEIQYFVNLVMELYKKVKTIFISQNSRGNVQNVNVEPFYEHVWDVHSRTRASNET